MLTLLSAHPFSARLLPVALATGVAAFVEGVEALTVVLAVGATRGWRSALAGCAAALLLLAAATLLLGLSLALLPLGPAQFAVGLLLLLFGLRWLRKAILRAAGVLPLHDEAAVYATEANRLAGGRRGAALDAAGFAAALQITLVEGLEVVFIVAAAVAGHADRLAAAGLGAAAALLAVAALGVAFHRPLTRVPENGLKLLVGALLSALGTFWIGEGSGLAWPGGDASLGALAIGYLAVAGVAAGLCRMRSRTAVAHFGGAR